MAKATKRVTSGVSGETLRNIAKNAVKAAKDGHAQMRWNMRLDRMAIDLHDKKFSADARAEKAQRLMKQSAELDRMLTERQKKGVSTYKPLADYYHRLLAGVTEEHFKAQAAEDARTFIAKSVKKIQSEITDEQRDIITRYFEERAVYSYGIIDEVRAVLESKGLLKKSGEFKLPTEEELQKALEAEV